MDQFAKYATKLKGGEREHFKEILIRIKSGDVSGLDIKKLKGQHSLYRVRVGTMRIIYRVTDSGEFKLIRVGNRNDNTYNHHKLS